MHLAVSAHLDRNRYVREAGLRPRHRHLRCPRLLRIQQRQHQSTNGGKLGHRRTRRSRGTCHHRRQRSRRRTVTGQWQGRPASLLPVRRTDQPTPARGNTSRSTIQHQIPDRLLSLGPGGVENALESTLASRTRAVSATSPAATPKPNLPILAPLMNKTTLEILQYNVHRSKDVVIADFLRNPRVLEADIIAIQEP